MKLHASYMEVTWSIFPHKKAQKTVFLKLCYLFCQITPNKKSFI